MNIDLRPAAAEHRVDGPPPATPPACPPHLIEDDKEVFDQAAWNEWYRERIRRSLADPRPTVPHSEVVIATCRLLDELEARHVRKIA